MGRILENNQVMVSGEIEHCFVFSHETFGEKFYTTRILSRRLSGVRDSVPITVSDRLVNVDEEWEGKIVKVYGRFQSYSKRDGEKNRLILSVFVDEFVTWGEDGESLSDNDENHIALKGIICKETKYRKTPFDREITDIFLAVNRNYGKSDYIPCICWGRNARFAESLQVGDRIEVDGRIQSRTYIKRIDEEHSEERVAYEVSVSKISQIVESED